jgi:hypothetical protein
MEGVVNFNFFSLIIYVGIELRTLNTRIIHFKDKIQTIKLFDKKNS